MVLAYDLDAHLWLSLCTYHGIKKLSKGLVEITRELLKHRASLKGTLRLFFDEGDCSGSIFLALSKESHVRFYVPAMRYANNVAQWEQLQEDDFDATPFSFDKHAIGRSINVLSIA